MSTIRTDATQRSSYSSSSKEASSADEVALLIQKFGSRFQGDPLRDIQRAVQRNGSAALSDPGGTSQGFKYLSATFTKLTSSFPTPHLNVAGGAEARAESGSAPRELGRLADPASWRGEREHAFKLMTSGDITSAQYQAVMETLDTIQNQCSMAEVGLSRKQGLPAAATGWSPIDRPKEAAQQRSSPPAAATGGAGATSDFSGGAPNRPMSLQVPQGPAPIPMPGECTGDPAEWFRQVLSSALAEGPNGQNGVVSIEKGIADDAARAMFRMNESGKSWDLAYASIISVLNEQLQKAGGQPAAAQLEKLRDKLSKDASDQMAAQFQVRMNMLRNW